MSYDDQLHTSSSDMGHTNFAETEHHDDFQASAPPSDDNGFYVVPDAENTHEKVSADSLLHESQNKDEMSKILADIANSADASLNKLSQKVLAEADSSTMAPPASEEQAAKKPECKKTEGKSDCAICPYYALGNYLFGLYFLEKGNVKIWLIWLNWLKFD